MVLIKGGDRENKGGFDLRSGAWRGKRPENSSRGIVCERGTGVAFESDINGKGKGLGKHKNCAKDKKAR